MQIVFLGVILIVGVFFYLRYMNRKDDGELRSRGDVEASEEQDKQEGTRQGGDADVDAAAADEARETGEEPAENQSDPGVRAPESAARRDDAAPAPSGILDALAGVVKTMVSGGPQGAEAETRGASEPASGERGGERGPDIALFSSKEELDEFYKQQFDKLAKGKK
jgi:hypothetical protein